MKRPNLLLLHAAALITLSSCTLPPPQIDTKFAKGATSETGGTLCAWPGYVIAIDGHMVGEGFCTSWKTNFILPPGKHKVVFERTVTDGSLTNPHEHALQACTIPCRAGRYYGIRPNESTKSFGTVSVSVFSGLLFIDEYASQQDATHGRNGTRCPSPLIPLHVRSVKPFTEEELRAHVGKLTSYNGTIQEAARIIRSGQ